MNPISLFSIKIDCFYNEIHMMSGSGFFYKHPSQNLPYLITNYHVLTCRLPKTPSALMNPKFGSSPNKIKCHAWGKNPLACHTFSLIIEQESEWLEHPRRAEGIDMVGIPVIFQEGTPHTTQLDIGTIENITIDVATDLFIVGYPLGLSVNERLPIWKKGTIASEPSVSINGLPCFYIDASTKEGMSGSPVFASETNKFIQLTKEQHDLYERKESGDISPLEFISKIKPEQMINPRSEKQFKLIGLYSGRVTVGNSHPDIGIVWKKELIDEMFESDNLVKAEFPPFSQ